MSSDNNNHTDVLLEDMQAKFDAVMEILIPMRDEVAGIPSMRSELEEVKADVKVIKAAVTDNSSQLNDHETRISQLEAA